MFVQGGEGNSNPGGDRMKTVMRGSWLVAGLIASLLINASAQAPEETAVENAPAEEAAPVEIPTEKAPVEEGDGGFRFGIGLTYASGIDDVYDFVEEEIEARGFDPDGFSVPAGLTLVFGYRFDFGGEILVDAGPASVLIVDVVGADDTYYNWDVPVGLTAGYAFFRDSSISPYIRGGVRYHFTDGDFSDDSSAGWYAAGGVDFFANKAVNLQLEVAYDAAQVTYKTPEEWPLGVSSEEIEPGALMISIRAVF